MVNTQIVYSRSSIGAPQQPGVDRPDHAQTAAQPAATAGRDKAEAPSAPAEALPPEAAKALVEDMNQALQSINTGLQFSLDDQTGKTVIKVIDRETGETLRQFPSEEALSIAHALDKLRGVLIRQSA